MVSSDDLHERLSPQQWRVWCMLRNGRNCGIETLYRQACPTADHSSIELRRKQMRVGAVISEINAVLKEDGWNCCITPGTPRHSYQLRYH